MDFELSFKNKRVRIWFWLMVPAFILSIALFIYLPNRLSMIGASPLLIGYFSYLGWGWSNRKNTTIEGDS
jgi:lipopolysaccharide export LptBFGC system permease protein LptF